ncbi:hypothetical protein [Nocardia cyriacigeorgica]|uniref:hypothetical protein n=1 Tax=Nocardia cyriacigeorgica TaxID=135487 RepID=UPI0024560112|nr:hypothetical protein [Nocardia cyriacigeorgica]
MSDESDRTESPQPDDPEAESRWITRPSAAAPPLPRPAGREDNHTPPLTAKNNWPTATPDATAT